ncbi:MAG: hypothetical protein Q7T97_03385 [Burkholderiaceae bacterium]|nr:hypothetical protein [Burkholderiaceae bacterium]
MTGAAGADPGRRFDVCNGDADGLCAVVQWRLHAPAPAVLVTGIKRDIELLKRVDAGAGDEVLVCDVSLQSNRGALQRLLERGATVRYFDHHAAGDVPVHPLLESHLTFDPRSCTSLLMDAHLNGEFRHWALVGIYGDNLAEVADALPCRLGEQDRARLRQLGEALNYNAYGDDEGDVRIHPARLYETLVRYRDPLDLMASEPLADDLIAARRADLKVAACHVPYWQDEHASVTLLPDAPWSRRVIGCLANQLARAQPRMAHAVLKERIDGDYVVSVRAPLSSPWGAHGLCSRFGGAGRAAAAGIDRLAVSDLPRFIGMLSANRWVAP